jgi:hypothetical protein
MSRPKLGMFTENEDFDLFFEKKNPGDLKKLKIGILKRLH